MKEEKRCCENCGSACAKSIFAYLWDLCVESNFSYWIPKEEPKESEE